MRSCRLIVTETGEDGKPKDKVMYSSVQRTNLQRMLNHLVSTGKTARIECDPPHKRRVRINSITGKPRGSHTHV